MCFYIYLITFWHLHIFMRKTECTDRWIISETIYTMTSGINQHSGRTIHDGSLLRRALGKRHRARRNEHGRRQKHGKKLLHGYILPDNKLYFVRSTAASKYPVKKRPHCPLVKQHYYTLFFHFCQSYRRFSSEFRRSFLHILFFGLQNPRPRLLGDGNAVFAVFRARSVKALAGGVNAPAPRHRRQAVQKLDGFLHAIAMDKTIRNKSVKPMLEVTAEEFNDTMTVSAFSLISLSHVLLMSHILQKGASIVSLSYIAAEKVSFFPYINMSIAKAALERLTIEMAYELGRDYGIRANCVRFSPYMGSKAGNATLKTEDVDRADRLSPLGNATPEDLAHEVVHLFRPETRITGEIRHVDGGFHIMG